VVGKIKAMDYSIIDLANKIIEQVQKMKVKMLGLTKLQKLVYYVYGEYLAQEKIRLVKDDEPQKWPHGPVFFQLYKETRTMGIINTINCKTLESLENIEIEKDKQPDHTRLDEIIAEVLQNYGERTAIALSKDTHRSGYAWDKTQDFGLIIADKHVIDEFNEREQENNRISTQ
jgi:uncharacterized phage-associated protein